MLEQQIKENVGNVKEAASAMLDGIKNNKELEEVIGTSESIKKGSKIIQITFALTCGLLGMLITYLFPNIVPFVGYTDESHKKIYPVVALAASATSNDKEFESMSTWKLFRNPSISDVKLTRYWSEGNDFFVESTNTTDQYVYVKIIAKASGLNGKIDGVAYGVIAPKSTVKVLGHFDKFVLDIDPTSIKVEKVAIFDMDKAIDNYKKSVKK